MKKLFLLLVFIHTLVGLGATTVDRPLEIIVNFPPPYPREFAAYFNNPTAYSITVINHTDQDQTVYFLGKTPGLNERRSGGTR